MEDSRGIGVVLEQKHLIRKQVFGFNLYTKVVYTGTDYEKELPTKDAIEFVHDLVLDSDSDDTGIGKLKLEKVENVMGIISDNMMFKGPEWEDLSEALKKHKFEYACNHPCFWNFKKRLMFFDDVYSLVTSGDDKRKAIAYEAIKQVRMFDDNWRGMLDDPHEAPLKRVLDKYGSVMVMASDASREEKRCEEGIEMILFMKNCFDHLTSVEIGPLNERYYSHIDFMSDDPLYKDIEFFNHMATHFLYPKLWIELYTALYIGGYKF